MKSTEIIKLTTVNENIDELAQLMKLVVDDGASIGFLPPLKLSRAKYFWGNVIGPGVILFIAKVNNEITGTVQLHVCQKENGCHRAEIAKLMTHPSYRRNGVARLLMQIAEEQAKQEGCSLLMLDTREGDPSNLLYQSMGYIEAGRIPNYAMSANGQLHASVFYYKNL